MQGSRSACTGRALLAREALSSHERRALLEGVRSACMGRALLACPHPRTQRARPMQAERTPFTESAHHVRRARPMRAERAPCKQSAPHASRVRLLHGERAPCKESAPLVQAPLVLAA